MVWCDSHHTTIRSTSTGGHYGMVRLTPYHYQIHIHRWSLWYGVTHTIPQSDPHPQVVIMVWCDSHHTTIRSTSTGGHYGMVQLTPYHNQIHIHRWSLWYGATHTIPLSDPQVVIMVWCDSHHTTIRSTSTGGHYGMVRLTPYHNQIHIHRWSLWYGATHTIPQSDPHPQVVIMVWCDSHHTTIRSTSTGGHYGMVRLTPDPHPQVVINM